MKPWHPAFLMMLACSVAARATPDPPGLVGRIGHADGNVWVHSASDPDGQSDDHSNDNRAGVNWPLSAGDRVRTDDTRAELNLGRAMLRLAPQSDVTIREFDENKTRLEIASGTVTLQVRELTNGNTIHLQLPHSTVELRQAGNYVVDVSPAELRVLVRSGEAGIKTTKARFEQFTREQAHIELDGTVTLTKAPSADAFENWSLKRAEAADRAQSALHVPKGLIGFEDLDAYGEWHWERAYGMVWKPRKVSRDWAPFLFGHWIWKAPWGWTWIDAAPWGFAPSHYGRWVNVDSQWLWVPGPRQIPPVYVPAMVGWTDYSAEENRIGWFPLGPHEAYVPPYAASAAYQRRVNTFTIVKSRTPIANDSAARRVIWASPSVFADHPLPHQTYPNKRLAREVEPDAGQTDFQ